MTSFCELKMRDSTKNSEMKSVENVLSRGSYKFASKQFDCTEDNLSILKNNYRILIIGLGHLGCEILKNLIHSGFTDIEIMDKATVSRQFNKGSYWFKQGLVFRRQHIGTPKVDVIAEYFNQKYKHKNISITGHQKDITATYDNIYTSPLYIQSSFYTKFDFIIVALRSIRAKSMFNNIINDLLTYDYDAHKRKHIVNGESIIPWIDAYCYDILKGDISIFIPTITPCFACNLDDKIRTASNEIKRYGRIVKKYEYESYVTEIKNAMYCFNTFNCDDTKDIRRLSDIILYNRGRYSEGVIPIQIIRQIAKDIQENSLTRNRMKLSIMMSTYSITAGIVCNEVFKLISGCSLGLNNRYKYNGYNVDKCHRLKHKKRSFCSICGVQRILIFEEKLKNFQDLFNRLKQSKTDDRMIISLTAVHHDTKTNITLYHRGKYFVKQYEENFDKKIHDLIKNGSMLQCVYAGKMVKEFVVDYTEIMVTGWFRTVIELKYHDLNVPIAIQLLIGKFVESERKDSCNNRYRL